MPNNNEVKHLFKIDDGTFHCQKAKSSFRYRCRKTVGICDSLQKPVGEYSPAKTVESIQAYITAGDRIIYSEITKIVYNMPSKKQATFNSNLESLMDYVLNEESNTEQSVQNAVIRLWDHAHLAMHQVENAKEILEKSTAQVKETLHDELYEEFKGMEKEYITILGIFSSVVISFVAGITFSTSVLENMHNVGIFRLVLVILLIAFAMLNVINLLVRYIFSLNKKESCKFPMSALNAIFAVLLLLLVLCWTFSLDQLPDFLGNCLQLPWVKQ